MPFVTVARVPQVPAGRGRAVLVQGCRLALFNINGTFYAIDDSCPHKGASLASGPVAGTDVVCPLHLARFDIVTGASLTPVSRRGVRTYKVQVVGEEIQVEVP